MSKPTLFQIGCFYMEAETLNVGRAIEVSDGLWTLLSYNESTFDVEQESLRVACKEDMGAWHAGVEAHEAKMPPLVTAKEWAEILPH